MTKHTYIPYVPGMFLMIGQLVQISDVSKQSDRIDHGSSIWRIILCSEQKFLKAKYLQLFLRVSEMPSADILLCLKLPYKI